MPIGRERVEEDVADHGYNARYCICVFVFFTLALVTLFVFEKHENHAASA